MKLLTKALESQLPRLYANDGRGNEAMVIVKFFTPDSNWTWYATEYDPIERVFFGLVDGLDMELGYFSLDELESLRGPLGLPIERDIYFTSVPLSSLMNQRR